MKKRTILFIGIIFAIISLILVFSSISEKYVKIGDEKISVEISDTNEERRKG